MTKFLILGNGGGGTSLMRGLLNTHSHIECLFENKESAGAWLDYAKRSSARVWGNKMPVEQFVTRGWSDQQIIRLSDSFLIVWITRRFSRYNKPGFSTEENYRQTWEWTRKLYWASKERNPERVLQVSFEDLLIRPVIELKRICVFLGVRYEPEMLQGTNDTGLGRYNQPSLNRDKI